MKETNGMNISFILPVYNVAPFLEDCIASISDQGLTVEQYEIICIDDCSTDDSYRKLHMLSSQYINMRILQNEKNSGVSFTRNRGIREAKGAYVWFVDPDDYIIKNAVEVTYTVAKKENADIVLGNYIRVAEQSIPGGDICQLMTYSAREVARPIDNMNRRMSAVWCGMFKRDFLVTNNLLFNENMIAQEDTLFYYQFEQCERKLVKLDAFIYCYRQRADSVMNVRTEAKRKGYYYAMREMLNVYNDMLKNRDIADSITLSKKYIIVNKIARIVC